MNSKILAFLLPFLISFGVFAQQGRHVTAEKVKIMECIAVDSVPADFPVGFSSLTTDKWQFIAYYNKNRNMTVASRKLTDNNWNYKVLPTKVGWDSHNKITMAFDRVFCIHVSGNMHNDTLTYFKTEKPLDISTFHKVFPLVSKADELSSTYPGFMKSPQNQLIFKYRKGGSGNGITITNIYNEKTKTFKRLNDKPLFDGLNQMSAYASGPSLGPDGYYHLIWLWRNTPRCETNHSPSYARSKDLVNWESLDGTKLSLPITPHSTQFIVDPVQPGGGVINGAYRLFFDHHNKPLLVYMKYDNVGNNQLFVAKAENGKWMIHQISNWNDRWEFKGPGSITFEIRIINAKVENNTISIAYFHKKRGNGALLVDLESMRLLEDHKLDLAEKTKYPKELMQPQRSDEGMQVHWLKLKGASKNAETHYVLRWETMGKRRFYEAPKIPVKPSALKLYKFTN